MALINYIKKEEATGKISEIYRMLENRLNILPNVVQFHTASPKLFEKLMGFLSYFFDHPNIDNVTTAYIRLLISGIEEGEYCIRFQSSILKYLGISEEDIEISMKDYKKLKLDPKRKELICFVLDAMYNKLEDKSIRIQLLRGLGWTDEDIYDASALAALQKGMVKVVSTFEVELDF